MIGNDPNVPKPQLQRSLDPRDYKVIVCVAGTRYYNDRRYFHKKIIEFLETQTDPVLFVSGCAPSGADDLIIRWCERYGYPCLKMPADWDTLGNSAGFIRNGEMSKVVNYLIAFWDGVSHGTADMIDRCEALHIPAEIIKIPHVPRPKPYSGFSKSTYHVS